MKPRIVALATLLLLLAGCGSDGGSPEPAASPLSPAAQLGENIFKDESLSASGRMSCQTCHALATGHAGASSLPAELGGADLTLQSTRTAPSIRYLHFNGAFHFDDEDTPTGGFFWDGRAESLQAQAGEPFLNPREMALPTRAAVVERLRAAPYAGEFERVFGAGILADVERAYERMTFALAQYQREDAEFAAFSSKYDAFLAGRAQLTAQEARGLELFNAADKGNCAACHPSERGADGTPPLFTDFTYDALGVPRNPELRVNDDPAYFDLGLCARADLADRTDLCGAFKVPSLRNVALRKRYFHNGRFADLREVVDFYVTRDTAPERWYPVVDGVVRKFDDLPPAYHGNVNTSEAPYDRKAGDAPALTPDEIDAVVAFLRTLSDDWQP
ncbi:MAG: cytochrome-c peroxidase [Burkholderiales bacterium]|jgi:cytochrome c peroxidase|nr:cytochrome-c peroxidase [Burkholderiales bacterium]